MSFGLAEIRTIHEILKNAVRLAEILKAVSEKAQLNQNLADEEARNARNDAAVDAPLPDELRNLCATCPYAYKVKGLDGGIASAPGVSSSEGSGPQLCKDNPSTDRTPGTGEG